VGWLIRTLVSDSNHVAERDGVIYRNVIPSSPPTVEYGLSPLGRRLVPAVEAIAQVGLELKRVRTRHA